jgi:hypothetical protein
MDNVKNTKHDELCQVYGQINEEGRKTLIQVADQLRKAQLLINKQKSTLLEQVQEPELIDNEN